MTQYTRRRLLSDLGIASASIVGLGIQGCCSCHPPSDLYVMLQGPWLLSIANSLFLRAATTKLDAHLYSYFDPRLNTWPSSPADDSNCETSILRAAASTDLSKEHLIHLDVRPSCDRLWPMAQRRRLFEAMRDQAQGLFYTGEVYCPDIFDCSLNALEIHLSYPDAIFGIGMRGDVKFSNLDYIEGSNVKCWPSTIVLRYRNWSSATFFGENIPSETLLSGRTEIHRKFGISYLLPSPGPCDFTKPASESVSSTCASVKPSTEGTTTQPHAAPPLDIEADEYWASVMRLVKFKYGKIPKPTFPVCKDAGNAASSETVVDGVITQDELKCLPLNPTPGAQNAKLVASAAGSAGVHSA